MHRISESVHRGVRGAVRAAGALAALGALWVGSAAAQQPPPAAPDPAPVEDGGSYGLPTPKGLDWAFNLDASWGIFGFANSLYQNPKPEQPSGDLSDNWFEGAVKPALSGIYTSSKSWQVYMKLSAVGERTYSSPPTLVGDDASSFKVEDLSIGWRSGKSVGKSENMLDFTVGRTQYQLGHGFLVWDGSAEGGTRGGYWSNARKAFEFAAIGRFKPGRHTFETFYLDKDDLPEANSGSKTWGANYQIALGEATTLGATYMKWYAHANEAPQRDGLNVANVRAYTTPFKRKRLSPLSFEAEYAKEDNGDALDSTAWTVQAAYQLPLTWKPRLSYRYASFEGDDPNTTKREAIDPLFLGFYDWGTWWQGEIAGEYFLANSNLNSHQIRVHATPSDAIGTGLIFYDFRLDRPEAAGAGVTSPDAAKELDGYLDWKANKNFTFSFIAAYANPGKAAEQASGRTKDFAYGMIYAAYSY